MKSLKLYIITAGIAVCNLHAFGMRRSQTRQDLQLESQKDISLPRKPLRVYVALGKTLTQTLEDAIINRDSKSVSELHETKTYTQITQALNTAIKAHLESHNRNGILIGCSENNKPCTLKKIQDQLQEIVQKAVNQKKLLENAIRTNDIDMMRINLTTSTYRQDTLADALALANELHTTAHMDRKGRITGCATNAPCNLAQIKNLLKSYIKN